MSEPAPRHAAVPVRGTRSASGPLTWGQQAIWAAIRRTRPEDQYFNHALVHVIEDAVETGTGPTTGTVLAALAAVVERHESLRTRLLDEGEEPRQQVHTDGRLLVPIRETGEAELQQVAHAVAAELTAEVFDYRAEWPLRVAVLQVAGRPRRVVFGFCHLAADGGAADVVLRDFARFLADPADDPEGDAESGPAAVAGEPAPQPLDLALDQDSAAGRARNAATIAWWDAEYRRIPPSMFHIQVAPAAEPRYWTGRIGSPALGPATAHLARVSRTGATAVLMAGITRLVGEFTGEELVAMLPILSNRFQSARRDLVSSLALEGLLVVPVTPGTPFLDHVRATWTASLKGYQHAEYDDRARDAMAAAVAADRGGTVHPYCCFNDLRDLRAPSSAPPARMPDGPAVFDWSRKPEKVSCRFCVHVVGDAEDFTVELTGDTCYLPPPEIERFLRELEALIVTEARALLP